MIVPAWTKTCRSKYYNFKIVLTFLWFHNSVHQLGQQVFLILQCTVQTWSLLILHFTSVISIQPQCADFGLRFYLQNLIIREFMNVLITWGFFNNSHFLYKRQNVILQDHHVLHSRASLRCIFWTICYFSMKFVITLKTMEVTLTPYF
jgi:hypothetical protein